MDLWRNLSYKKKTQLLWLGGFLFLFLAYQLAISKTIRAYKGYRYYQDNRTRSMELQQERIRLQTRLQEIDETFTISNDSVFFREAILAQISEFAGRNDLLVSSVPAITYFKDDTGLMIASASFYIEGRFTDLLRLTESLERDLPSAQISSASFNLRESRSGDLLTVVLVLRMNSVLMQ